MIQSYNSNVAYNNTNVGNKYDTVMAKTKSDVSKNEKQAVESAQSTSLDPQESKVDRIKQQISEGNYAVLDSKTLAKAFADDVSF